MSTSVTSSMLEFLKWVDARPRTYAETMDAWRTSCPRLAVWEDSQCDDLVRLEASGTSGDAQVVVTARGRAILDGA